MGWMSVLLKFLPLIMQILAVLFGKGALTSYGEVDKLLSADGGLFVGGQGAAAIAAMWASIWAAMKQDSWGLRPRTDIKMSGGISGLFKLVELLFEGFSILSKDAAWVKKFKEVTGFDVPTTLDGTANIVKAIEDQIRPIHITPTK